MNGCLSTDWNFLVFLDATTRICKCSITPVASHGSGIDFTSYSSIPFRRLVELEGPDCYIWLCVLELAGAASQALANLAIGRGTDHAKFTVFLNRYLPSFAHVQLELDDLRGGRPNERARTPQIIFTSFSGVV